MNRYMHLLSITIIGIFSQVLISCSENSKNATQNLDKGATEKMTNPVVYFEKTAINQFGPI